MSWKALSRTLELEAVQQALRLGWKLRPGSYKKRAHFYFDGPVLFSVEWKWNQVGYTVGRETMFSAEGAIQLLHSAAQNPSGAA